MIPTPVTYLLIAIVVESVVAAKSCESPQTDGIREKDLCAGINPDLANPRQRSNQLRRFLSNRNLKSRRN